MQTDRLVDHLVADLVPVRPRRTSHDLILLAAIGLVELGLFLLSGWARADTMMATSLPAFWWKLGSLTILTTVGAATATRSVDPLVSPRKGLRLLAFLAAGAFLAGWAIEPEHVVTAALRALSLWRRGLDCVFAMVILSVPAIVALVALIGRGAPTDRNGSSLAVGATSAAWGAFVFAFDCPHDDPSYIAIWYLVGCSIVTLIGSQVSRPLMRW